MHSPHSSAARMIAGLRDATLTLLYPNACRFCGAFIESWCDGVACSACWEAIEQVWKNQALCAKCGWPLPPINPHLEISERCCGRCQELAFTRARSCGPYEGAWREFADDKYHKRL